MMTEVILAVFSPITITYSDAMVENNDKNNNTDQERTRVDMSDHEDNSLDARLNEIESDSDTLEPQELGAASGRIIVEDPNDLSYLSGQFQIGSEELKAAIVMSGNSVLEIKKYLSIWLWRNYLI